MKTDIKTKIFSVISVLWEEFVKLAKEYGLSEKIENIILKSGVLDDIQKQIADFALVAVYQAEFATVEQSAKACRKNAKSILGGNRRHVYCETVKTAFNKIGREKKKLAFKMICNFIKYPAALKPFKPLIESILFEKISDEIEDAVLKLKEHLRECKQ